MAQATLAEHYLELIDTLEAELRAYESLYETCKQEKDALVKTNQAEIRRTAAAKDVLLQRIRSLDFQRERVALEIGVQLKLVGPIRLKQIIEKASEKQASQLRALQLGLELKVSHIKELNEMNGRLIAAALETVKGALDSIRGSLSEKPVYKKEGKVESKTLSGQFVSREA